MIKQDNLPCAFKTCARIEVASHVVVRRGLNQNYLALSVTARLRQKQIPADDFWGAQAPVCTPNRALFRDYRIPGGTVNAGLLPSFARINRFLVPDADATAPPRSYDSVTNNNVVRISEADGGRLRRVEWPELGRVKRQRAGDERRSKTTDKKKRSITNSSSSTETTAASPAASSTGAGRGAPPQQHVSSAQEGPMGIQAARRRPIERIKFVGERRSRPARGDGGGGGDVGGGGSRDGKKPQPQRKRPASAEIWRDHHLEGCAYREDGPRIPTISEATRHPVEPNWQPLGGVGRVEASLDNNKLEPGVAVADDRLCRRPPYSRRTMSAHSRLEEGSRTRDSTASAIGRDGRGGGGGSNARVNRPRWSTAGVLRESASQSMSSIVCGDRVRGQQSERGRNSLLSDARDMSPELEAEQMGGRCSAEGTAENQPQPNEDRVVAASHTSAGRTIRFESSASAPDIHNRSRKSSTELGPRKNPGSPTTPIHRAGRALAEPQAADSRGIDNSTFVRTRVSLNPQKVGDTSEERPTQSIFDNGRDGKLYLNPWLGEPPGGSGSLGSETNELCADNGRDGKFYLGVETDTQRSRLTNLEPDYNSLREEGGKEANRTCKVESVRATEEVAVNEERVELAKEHTEVSSVGGSSQQRSEAARTIQKALIVAVLRRRSVSRRVDKKLQRVLSDAAETGEARKQGRRMPLEINSDLATIDHHVSVATGVGDAKEECTQLRTASPAEALEVR